MWGFGDMRMGKIEHLNNRSIKSEKGEESRIEMPDNLIA